MASLSFILKRERSRIRTRHPAPFQVRLSSSCKKSLYPPQFTRGRFFSPDEVIALSFFSLFPSLSKLRSCGVYPFSGMFLPPSVPPSRQYLWVFGAWTLLLSESLFWSLSFFFHVSSVSSSPWKCSLYSRGYLLLLGSFHLVEKRDPLPLSLLFASPLLCFFVPPFRTVAYSSYLRYLALPQKAVKVSPS